MPVQYSNRQVCSCVLMLHSISDTDYELVELVICAYRWLAAV